VNDINIATEFTTKEEAEKHLPYIEPGFVPINMSETQKEDQEVPEISTDKCPTCNKNLIRICGIMAPTTRMVCKKCGHSVAI
jgi:hypothetical protein